MADKKRVIVLYLSEYKEKCTSFEYIAPDGKTYTGEQTNDAPMKYLLAHYENIEKIVCITTPEADSNDLHGRLLCSGCLSEAVEWVTVKHSVDDDFSETALPEIVEAIGNAPETELLLETTGGLRSAVMELLLVSRVLSYTGVNTVAAVYSNFPVRKIEDVTKLVRMFDLAGGMQELTGFGSVRTLKKYYHGNSDMEALIESMGELTELISLCRTERLDETIRKVNRTLAAVRNSGEQDAVTRLLLPVFREKFGQELTIPGLIRWCVENDMLQQAMTIYGERIPREIIEIRGLLTVTGGSEMKNDYQDRYSQQFVSDFLMMSSRNKDYSVNAKASVKKLFDSYNNEQLQNLPIDAVRYETWKKTLSNLQCFIRLHYGGETGSIDKSRCKEPSFRAMQSFVDCEQIPSSDEFINELYYRRNLFWTLAEQSQYVATVDKLQTLLNPKNEFRNDWDTCVCSISISVSDMQTIARDYMYIKILRNMTNHANDTETFDQEIQMRYLEKWYTPLSKISTESVKKTLLTALAHLDTASRRKR